MSATKPPDFVLETRGVHRALGAFVVAAQFDRSGRRCAFALGDGTLRLVDLADRQDWRQVVAHEGAVLGLAADPAPGGFVTGGDDGALRRIDGAGEVAEIARFGSRWVEHVASFAPERGAGLIACAVGKVVHLLETGSAERKTFDHPSSVAGVVFDAKGKRIAAAHYGGASLWFVGARSPTPRVLEWKGSHIGIAMSPDGDAVVTAMQENSLHGWRLSDGQHMRMSGYPAKTNAMSFSRNGKWLATSGAETVVLWPFFGGGPMGKAPTELAGGDGVQCTQVACHPNHDAVAAGFGDGLMLLADIGTARILPVAAGGRGAVSTIAWSPDGSNLAFGTEDGFAAVVDFSPR